jgi:hypothetical protein
MRQGRWAYAGDKERMDKFYRQSVARRFRDSGMFLFKLKPRRGVARVTLQARSSRVGRVRSGGGRDTDATRFLAEFHGGLVRMLKELKGKPGRGWRRLSQKVEAGGGKQQSSAGNSPSRWEEHLQPRAREASSMIGPAHREC